MEALGTLTKNLAKRSNWTRADQKDVKTGYSTELMRTAMTKQRVNKEDNQFAAEFAKIKIDVRSIIKQEGHATGKIGAV